MYMTKMMNPINHAPANLSKHIKAEARATGESLKDFSSNKNRLHKLF
jgi:hypothetical protein